MAEAAPSAQPPPSGPLHLQGYLAPCPEELARALRGAVDHPVTVVLQLVCPCRKSGLLRAIEENQHSSNPAVRQKASARLVALESLAQQRHATARAGAPVAVPNVAHIQAANGEGTCRLFDVELNQPEGIARAFCRRCRRMFPVYDRELFWGTRRKTSTPPKAWPCSCPCGGHTFEVAIGLDYPEDRLDENDLHTIAVALRCPVSGEVQVVLDEEAT